MKRSKKILNHGLACLLFLIGMGWLPFAWFSRDADRWYAGDAELQTKLANGVGRWTGSGLNRESFTTGSEQFDGEWLFGTYMMAAMGYGQCTLEQPENRERYLALMEKSIEQILSGGVRTFDIERWGNDPLETLDQSDGHAAYLGYLNLTMSFHRLLNPESRFAELNDRITTALRRRVENSQTLLLESYPRETYPVDNCAVIASIALHAKAAGTHRDPLVIRWAETCRQHYIDPKSGLLFQAVDGQTGTPLDYPRGSGTILGLYLLSFADMELSAELYEAVKENLAGQIFGFGGVREYPENLWWGMGDIDSGPIVLGYGLSATGFSLGGARIHQDQSFFKRLYATAHACGVPCERKDRLNFITGASLGDAILFAMLTACPGGIEEVTQ